MTESSFGTVSPKISAEYSAKPNQPKIAETEYFFSGTRQDKTGKQH